MKRNYLLLICLFVAVFFASCKSTPKEEPVKPETEETVPIEPAPEKPAEPTVTKEEPKVDNSAKIEALFNDADNARDLAMAAEAPSLLEDEWNKVEETYTQIKSDYNKNAADDSIMDRIKNAQFLYEALENASKALAAESRIKKLGFIQRDQSDYDKGSAALDELEALYNKNASGKELAAKAAESNDAFQKVLYNSFRQLAVATRESAIEKKNAADSINVGVAAKDAYKTAVKALQEGDVHYVTKDPEAAYQSYQDAETRFDSLYMTISEKRSAAEKAIADAKAKVSSTAEYAEQADQIAPIADDSNMEGIEKDDTVLVEQEDYEDPQDAVISVDSVIKEGDDEQ